jgi:hypothetical protein
VSHVCEQDEKRSLEKQEEQQVENQENSIYFFLLLLFLLISVCTQLPGLMMSNMFISNKELPHSSSFGRKV